MCTIVRKPESIPDAFSKGFEWGFKVSVVALMVSRVFQELTWRPVFSRRARGDDAAPTEASIKRLEKVQKAALVVFLSAPFVGAAANGSRASLKRLYWLLTHPRGVAALKMYFFSPE